MQIHVVRPGESVFQIANRYNTSAATIISSNELDEPGNLVVGQALVIPTEGQFYEVQPGDSPYTIAQRFRISVDALLRANRLFPGVVLNVGQRLFIPPREMKRSAEANAYVEPLTDPVTPELIQATRSTAPFLTYLAPFSYRVSRQGTLIPPPLNDFLSIARMNQASPMMVVTNLEEGAFSSELGHIILSDTELQDRLLTEIINTALENGFRDVHFDFEFLLPEDVGLYNAFIVKARDRIHDAGLLISTALAPKVSGEQEGPWYTAHDYPFHGQMVDFVVLMTYEWGYSGGPAMAVSPLDKVEEVVNYAISVIPPNKIMLGQNLYGYDWTLPFVEGTFAKAVSPQEAIRIARENNVSIQFDETAQAPYFNYVDAEGKRHEVWFEDARSIQSKFDLIERKNLRGISYWKLGLSFPQNWLLLDNNFHIVKRG